MDDDMLRIFRIIDASIKDPEQRDKLIKEIQQKRECIKILWDHYEKVLIREKKGSGP